MLEIQYHPYSATCDFKIVQHLTTFEICYFFYGFCINDNGSICDQIRNEFSNFMILIDDIETFLLFIWNLPRHKLYTQSIFIWLFQQPMTKHVQHFKGTIDNIVHFFSIQ